MGSSRHNDYCVFDIIYICIYYYNGSILYVKCIIIIGVHSISRVQKTNKLHIAFPVGLNWNYCHNRVYRRPRGWRLSAIIAAQFRTPPETPLKHHGTIVPKDFSGDLRAGVKKCQRRG